MAHKSYWHKRTADLKMRRDIRRRLWKFEHGESLNLIGYVIDRIRARRLGM